MDRRSSFSEAKIVGPNFKMFLAPFADELPSSPLWTAGVYDKSKSVPVIRYGDEAEYSKKGETLLSN